MGGPDNVFIFDALSQGGGRQFARVLFFSVHCPVSRAKLLHFKIGRA
jgi:hypothetical protein